MAGLGSFLPLYREAPPPKAMRNQNADLARLKGTQAMSRRSPSPDRIAEAVSLRAAGYTVTAISERTGISVRSLNRIFQKHGAKKGAVRDELIETAKRSLIEAVTSNDRIREEAARIVMDDLAHARLLRERMAVATEHFNATNLEEAALLMRAAAAYSTALKNTSDMLRHSLRTERALEAGEAEDLPDLVLREISDEEAKRQLSGQDATPDDLDSIPQASSPGEPEAPPDERDEVVELDDDR